MTEINVIYRLSDNGYNKPKFANATKLHCLENCITKFDINNMFVFVDDTNLLPATKAEVERIDTTQFFGDLNYYTGGSSAGSWRHVLDYALKNFTNPDDVVYFLEDDYLHLTNSAKVLIEGLKIAEYVSLYDHNDKYIPASNGGNAFIGDDAGELTKVFRTPSSHWKLTNSTTMTFATTMKQLREDEQVWREFTTGTHPNDFACFMKLRELNRALITPIPGISTHCEPAWASPGINWTTV